MKPAKHQRFFAANQELRNFLRHAERLASQSDAVNEEELNAIWPPLPDLALEADASACEMLDEELQGEIAAYVKNLRALQQTVETIRCVMLARRAELLAPQRHLRGLHGWGHGYQLTL